MGLEEPQDFEKRGIRNIPYSGIRNGIRNGTLESACCRAYIRSLQEGFSLAGWLGPRKLDSKEWGVGVRNG